MNSVFGHFSHRVTSSECAYLTAISAEYSYSIVTTVE